MHFQRVCPACCLLIQMQEGLKSDSFQPIYIRRWWHPQLPGELRITGAPAEPWRQRDGARRSCAWLLREGEEHGEAKPNCANAPQPRPSGNACHPVCALKPRVKWSGWYSHRHGAGTPSPRMREWQHRPTASPQPAHNHPIPSEGCIRRNTAGDELGGTAVPEKSKGGML